MKIKFDASKMVKSVNNFAKYSDAFYSQAKMNEQRLTKKLAEISVDGFYDYLDGLARSHPGMLHHVYEWGQTGNPFGRLYDLKVTLKGKSATVSAEFLESQSVSESGTVPFVNKAEIMEEGIPVVIQEVEAKALFFEIDGQEFFRAGPIYIANPGGSETRGSFVKAFNEFYNTYFEAVFLTSIRFYDKLKNPRIFESNIKRAVKSSSPASLGRALAMSWMEQLTGDKI